MLFTRARVLCTFRLGQFEQGLSLVLYLGYCIESPDAGFFLSFTNACWGQPHFSGDCGIHNWFKDRVAFCPDMGVIQWPSVIIRSILSVQYAVGMSPVSIKLSIKTRCQDVSFPFRYPTGGFRVVALDVGFVEVSFPRRHWVFFSTNRKLLLTFKDTNERKDTNKNFLISGPPGR